VDRDVEAEPSSELSASSWRLSANGSIQGELNGDRANVLIPSSFTSCIATSTLSPAESPRRRARSDQLPPFRCRKLEAPGLEPAALRCRNWFA